MPGKTGITWIMCSALLVCTCFPSEAQNVDTWTDVAEEAIIRDDDSQISEDALEAFQELLLYPVNLNLATMGQLKSCGLFSAFQVQSIISYREKYGNLLSIYELASLKGFRKQRLIKLSAYMTVSKIIRNHPVKQSGTRILMFAGKSFSGTENQDLYPGSLWKTSLRIKSGIGRRVSAGLAYEKDPGERSLWGYRPEHLTGYLDFNGSRLVEKLIIGSYRINNGMGLIQGAGLMHTPEAIQSRPFIPSSLKPYAGAGENLIHQGAALKLNLGKTKILLWSSYQHIDLSLNSLDSATENTDWPDYIRETGMHRTSTELAGRNLGYLGCAGIQVSANFRKLTLGAQYFTKISGLSTEGKDSLQYFQGPSLHQAASIQWGWRLGKIDFYGEFAPGNKHSSAFIGGSRFLVNDFLSGVLQFHRYGERHKETFASAYASGSHVANESGLLLLIHSEPFREIRADLSIEINKYPAPRTQVLVPSSGFRYKLTLHNGPLKKLQWKFAMIKTTRQQTPMANLSGIRPLNSMQNNRIDGRISFSPFNSFTWQSRLVISYTPGNVSDLGHAALQQAKIRLTKRLKCTVQLVMFFVPSWDNRICLYEPGLYQQFRFPVYSGTGNKLTLVASMKTMKRFNIEGKCSVIRKNGIDKWEAGIQLRMNI